MPSPNPFIPVTSLENFLKAIDNLFENMVNSWSEVLFREDDREPIRRAWDDLRPKFQAYRDAIDFNSQTTQEALDRAGLGVIQGPSGDLQPGPQLQLKFHLLNRLWSRFTKFGWKKYLKDLLDYINKILKSLIEAIPGGGSIDEFKSALELAIDDEEEGP
jgi:hypothetical protein